MVALRELLTERKEAVRVSGPLGEWQPITIRFTGAVQQRDRGEAFKGSMFAAYPGDVVFSKIDARNGAVGVVPASLPKVVVTPEYPVMMPNTTRLKPAFLHHLLRAEHFHAELKRRASGTSGRKRITPEAFLSLAVPLPDLPEQDKLLKGYEEALAAAASLEADAAQRDGAALRDFESALGLTPPPSLPDVRILVTRFQQLERWSHEGALRAAQGVQDHGTRWPARPLGEALLEVRHGCSVGPAKSATTLKVLRISAVTRGQLDLNEFKYLADSPSLRATYSLLAGDILMCRTNGTLQYVGMSSLVVADVPDTVFPDKVIRVRPDRTKVLPAFLWRLLQVPAVRRQIEDAARTAVGNYAIGGADIKALRVPLPPIPVQRRLAANLNAGKLHVSELVAAATGLRDSSWRDFERALFDPVTSNISR